MRKWIFILIALIGAFLAYNYIYQDHRDIESEKAEFILSASGLFNEFVVNPSASEQKYLNKTIEVSGLVSEFNTNSITLNNNVFCQFDLAIDASVKINENMKVKGRFIGYDDLLEQVKLDQCIIQ